MINGVGSSGRSRIELPRTPVEGSSSVTKAGNASAGKAGGVASSASEIVSAGPPIDSDKVAAIRAAIAENRYPVDADKIAQAMIDLDLPRGA